MSKITPFLWLDNNAVEAKDFYLEVFEDSELLLTMPGPEGVPMGLTVRLNDLKLTLFNGGPHFKLNEAFSLFVSCADQDEIDYYWDKLTADGGSPDQCGWLKDKFDISWQIVPEVLGELLGGPDQDGAHRATHAMLGMGKLDIAELQAAYDSE